jgi:hypothetical protein
MITVAGTTNDERRTTATADRQASHSLARLFEQNGRVFLTGLDHGTRTFLNEDEITPGQPAECHDGDYVCLWSPGITPCVVVSECAPPRTPEDELFEFKKMIHAEIQRRLSVRNTARRDS